MSTHFLKIRTQIAQDIQNIYDEINIQLGRINNRDIATVLIRLETEKINIYITNLICKVRIAAIEELKEGSYPEYLTAGAWTKIIKSVGTPKIKLCSIRQINSVEFTNDAQSQHTTRKGYQNQELIQHLENRKIVSLGAAGIGGSAIVAALVIPGWEALPITLLCAGGAVLICGSVSAITTQREIETIKSRMEKEKVKSAPKQSSTSALTKKLTDFQAQNNIKLINEWMDKIEEAVDGLCHTANA